MDKIVSKIRNTGGEVMHVELRHKYLPYLGSLLEAKSLLDPDLQYLLNLYAELTARNYFNQGRASTSSAILEDLQQFVVFKSRDSVATTVGKTFICHQILEEMLFRLVKTSHFLIDLRMGIYRLHHPDLEQKSLHALCGELRNCIEFPSRDDLIKEVSRMNGMRNYIAHSLLTEKATRDIHLRGKEYLTAFRRLQKVLDESFEEVYEMIKMFNKWSDMFEEDLLESLQSALEDESIAYESEDIFAERSGLIL